MNLAFNHTLPWFDHVMADSARAERYDKMLHANGTRDGYEVSHTVQSYPWDKLGKATIVDVSRFVLEHCTQDLTGA